MQMDDNKFYSAHKLFGRDGGCALGLRMIVGHLDSRGLSWVTTCIIVYILQFMLGSSLALLYLLFFTLAVLLSFLFCFACNLMNGKRLVMLSFVTLLF